MQIKLNLQKNDDFNHRKYREFLKRMRWAYLDAGGERGTWREYANSKGIYYALKTYMNEIETDKDLNQIFNGIYVSKKEK